MNAWSPLFLFLLWITDAALVGYRDATARDPNIQRAEHYRAAIRRGSRLGLGISLLVAAVAAGLWWRAPDRAERLADFDLALSGLLIVWVPYALLALVIWTSPVGSARSGAVKALNLARPFVIAGAGLLGVWRSPGPVTIGLTAFACVLELLVEPILEWRTLKALGVTAVSPSAPS